MKERWDKLLSVKSIVTIVLTIVFAYLAVYKVIDAERFMVIYATIIAFYYGTQTQKQTEEKETDNDKNAGT